ncbi:preprotein translocase subunit SecG, partial [Lichenihabitans sp. Uapishka_5]|uniref:preprotein translocase subunit SecG n=1 Tax=Lichenihabitans sp. Uapishka_5 TaxID=3037302 RepID=UPI0029E819E8
MQTVLIVVHLLIVIALVGAVLLQRSEGGALGVGGGGGFMTGRGQANALTRATAILAALFFITSLALTLLANLHRAPRSIFDTPGAATPAGQAQPAATPGTDVLDQINQIQQQKSGAAPAP